MPAVNELFTVFREARSAAEVDPDVQIEDGPDPAAGPVMLEFKDVTYSYPGGDDGVHDLSFRAHTGEVTALAGRSGSGKSTSADLALGLLRPAEGQVLVGGRELTPARFAWWRRHVAYVPQDVLIVPGTLRHNLTWSVPREVSDEECFEVLRDAACDFAVDLADGLDTRLGDHGLRLSGGERQRVAIARALLRRPRFLVLDEATSALDDEREADVMDVITGLQPDVTVLMIAHRKTTLARADHVVHIVKGRRAVDLTKHRGSATPAALVDDAMV